MKPLTNAQYFERAAMNNKLIGHVPNDPNNKRFFEMGIEEITGDLRTKCKGLSLVLEMDTVADEDNLSDNAYLRYNKAYWIMHPIKDAEDYATQLQLRELCFTVALQMRSKLINDKIRGLYKGYERGTWNATPYIHLEGTAVGYRCTYLYKEPAPTQLNEADWNNETLAE